MRLLTLIAPTLLLVATACAPTAGADRYNSDLERLTADCTARGGILAPTGQQTGRPQTDNICKITGGASRLTSGG